MSLMKMTIMGMENYLKSDNDSLFKNISLPIGLDKQLVMDAIMLRCAELEVYYSDPHYMKAVTEHWFMKKYHTFEEWLRGLNSTYNPIENYDRYEDWTDKRTGKREDDNTLSDVAASSGSGTTATDVTADTSSSYLPDSEVTSSSSATSNQTTTGHNESNSSDNGEHSGHIHGNIGVTTAPAMLEEFYKISEWNIYDHIADAYKNEFCVGVYV